MRTFTCVCGHTLFFENTRCGSCERDVGWCPNCQMIAALAIDDAGQYHCANSVCGVALTKCQNYSIENVCNRCIKSDEVQARGDLCDCCRFNDTIPDLSVPGNWERWARLEAAKRRLFYALDSLGLPYGSVEDGFSPPLAFDFKGDIISADGLWRTMGESERAYTGHADGKITINIREADDAAREQLRVDLGEAHRTLLGHFRHEIGHYYWDLLVRGQCEVDFKTIFGNPMTPSYQEALDRHYQEGPPPGWQGKYVSAYATMHPWEDWAETFALYLDIASLLETATWMDLMDSVALDDLGAMVGRYRELGLVMNELNREMGLVDLIPEIITVDIIDKLTFIHTLVRRVSNRQNTTLRRVARPWN